MYLVVLKIAGQASMLACTIIIDFYAGAASGRLAGQGLHNCSYHTFSLNMKGELP
jgi:hypothetical protein